MVYVQVVGKMRIDRFRPNLPRKASIGFTTSSRSTLSSRLSGNAAFRGWPTPKLSGHCEHSAQGRRARLAHWNDSGRHRGSSHPRRRSICRLGLQRVRGVQSSPRIRDLVIGMRSDDGNGPAHALPPRSSTTPCRPVPLEVRRRSAYAPCARHQSLHRSIVHEVPLVREMNRSNILELPA